MTLYEVSTHAGRRFLWADSKNHAQQMYNEQTGRNKNAVTRVNRVWADNTNPCYRGYVTEDSLS